MRRLHKKLDGVRFGIKSRPGVRKLMRAKKNRAERRAARVDPEAQPMYGRYKGYEA